MPRSIKARPESQATALVKNLPVDYSTRPAPAQASGPTGKPALNSVKSCSLAEFLSVPPFCFRMANGAINQI